LMANPAINRRAYYRVSLRDEVKTGFQMSKLQSSSGPLENHAKHIVRGRVSRTGN
jgi:hypothetical protein